MGRRLGQHWLKNKSAIAHIINSLDLQDGDVVVEVGPGRGALTDPLLEACKELDCRVIALEMDIQLANKLHKTHADTSNIEVIKGDALKILPDLTIKNYKIAGNIPYYITGKLLRTITELKKPPHLATLTIQREVAERLTAKPPHMNLLAAAIGHAARVEIIMHLKEGDFSPPPKVRSSIVQLTHIKPYEKEDENYYTLIHTAFAHPRKQLKNNLKNAYSQESIEQVFHALNIPNNARAQNLSIEQFKQLNGSLPARTTFSRARWKKVNGYPYG